jgi:hypothetical protein
MDYYIGTCGAVGCSLCTTLHDCLIKPGDTTVYVPNGNFSLKKSTFPGTKHKIIGNGDAVTLISNFSGSDSDCIVTSDTSVSVSFSGFTIKHNGVHSTNYFTLLKAGSNFTYQSCDFESVNNPGYVYHFMDTGCLILVDCTYRNINAGSTYSYIYSDETGYFNVKLENCKFENISSSSTLPCIFSHLGSKLFFTDIQVIECVFKNMSQTYGNSMLNWGCLIEFSVNSSSCLFLVENSSFANITHNFFGLISMNTINFPTFSILNCIFNTISSSLSSGCIFINCANAATVENPNNHSFSIVDSSFISGSGGAYGGALYIRITDWSTALSVNPRTVYLRNCSFLSNRAPHGGAIGAETPSFTLTRVRFARNTATASGPAASDVHVVSGPTATMIPLSFSYDCAFVGGGSCSGSGSVRMYVGTAN